MASYHNVCSVLMKAELWQIVKEIKKTKKTNEKKEHL